MWLYWFAIAQEERLSFPDLLPKEMRRDCLVIKKEKKKPAEWASLCCLKTLEQHSLSDWDPAVPLKGLYLQV